MSKIYVPSDYVNHCNVFNDNYIRSYSNSSHTEWVDIYYKDNYALKSGSTNMSNPNVVCDTLNTYTDNIYHRYDIRYGILLLKHLLSFS